MTTSGFRDRQTILNVVVARRQKMTCAGARRKLEAYLQLAGSLAERLVYVYIDEGKNSSLNYDGMACSPYSDGFLNIQTI
jgi:hypothetical protein